MDMLLSAAHLRRELGEKLAKALFSSDNTEAVRMFASTLLQAAQADPQEYPVTVDYSKTLAEMISAGHYNGGNDEITAENFPFDGEGTVEVEVQLVHLNRVASTDEVLAHLEVNGLRPATLAELLAFGAANPDVQREFSVVALGSSWVSRLGARNVPYLYRRGAKRNLSLYGHGDQWNEICRFLAVRK